jgi:hypothetical protein
MINDPLLIALFASADQYLMADLYTITTMNGLVLRYTSLDQPLTVGGNTFLSSPLIVRSSIKQSVGVEVDDMQITVYPDASDMIGGDTWAGAAYKGILDNATFLVERAFFAPTWADYISKIYRFGGFISDIQQGGRTQIPISIKSDLFKLNLKLPLNIYQTTCRHALYDSGCGVNKATYQVASSVLAGSTQSLINCGLTQAGGTTGTYSMYTFGLADGEKSQFVAMFPRLVTVCTAIYINGIPQTTWTAEYKGTEALILFPTPPADGLIISGDFTYQTAGWFDLGTVVFTSGMNSGISRTVKSYAPGVLTFSLPFPYPPAVGDTFHVYAGCDKTMVTCNAKFSNLTHFSGEPFIPPAETAY